MITVEGSVGPHIIGEISDEERIKRLEAAIRTARADALEEADSKIALKYRDIGFMAEANDIGFNIGLAAARDAVASLKDKQP